MYPRSLNQQHGFSCQLYFQPLSELEEGELSLPDELSSSKVAGHWCRTQNRSTIEEVSTQNRSVKMLVIERCQEGDHTVPCRKVRLVQNTRN